MFLFMRLYCRAILHAKLWWDDYLLAVGRIFLLASTASLTEVFLLGYTTTTFSGPVIGPLNLAADDFRKMALGFSKTSFAFTLLRITKTGWEKSLIIGLTIAINLVFVVHGILVWKASCGLEEPWNILPCWPGTSGLYMNVVGAGRSFLPPDLVILIV
jgi:hypothetical protein